METDRFLLTTTYYPPAHIGGDAVHVRYLAEELAKRGHEVHVCYAADLAHLKGLTRRVTETGENGTEIHALSSELPLGTALLGVCLGVRTALVRRAGELARRIRPTVLHHHNIAGFGPGILALEADVRIYTAHDSWLLCPRGSTGGSNHFEVGPETSHRWCGVAHAIPPQLWRLRVGPSKLASRRDAIIAPSNYMTRLIEGATRWPRIVTIPNFVPGRKPLERGEPDIPYVLYVGVLEEHKGVEQLVRRFLGLPKDAGLELRLAGTGSLQPRLERLVRGQADRRIILEGWLAGDKLAALFENATATVLPSQGPDNCPLVALEALSYGSPLIVTNAGGLPEIAAAESCGFILDAELNGFGTAVQLLLEDRGKATEMRQRARLAYSTRYSPDVFMRSYLAVLSGYRRNPSN